MYPPWRLCSPTGWRHCVGTAARCRPYVIHQALLICSLFEAKSRKMRKNGYLLRIVMTHLFDRKNFPGDDSNYLGKRKNYPRDNIIYPWDNFQAVRNRLPKAASSTNKGRWPKPLPRRRRRQLRQPQFSRSGLSPSSGNAGCAWWGR